ncbi:Gfo/Idh/MocA family oxidoreductase [Chloroflexi bacterium TSY]|nr:Gfo/Idh/MocA family oxidoreductase [Chloroflexi bacterium TSY]
MKDQSVQVGIVGLGLVAISHLRGYQTHPRAKVVAVCDLDGHRAQTFAREHNIPAVYISFNEMLAHPGLNTVDIATPTYLHAEMTQRAATAGKHIHCEKPFCRNVGEGFVACDLARQNHVKLVVGETYAFIASHMKARELIDAGEIGRPLQMRQRHGAWHRRHQKEFHIGAKERSWRLNPEQSGGGDYPWIFDHAVHFFATAEYLMPGRSVNEVYAVTSQSRAENRQQGAAHDPYSTAEVDIPIITWTYDDPSCQGVWMRAEPLNGKYDFMHGFSTSIIGEQGMIEVLGEGGHNLLWEGQQQHLVLHRNAQEPLCFRFDEGGDRLWASDVSYYGQGHINQVHHLIDCIIHDQEPRYNGQNGVQAVRCTLATIRSAQESRPVKVSEIEAEYTAY